MNKLTKTAALAMLSLGLSSSGNAQDCRPQPMEPYRVCQEEPQREIGSWTLVEKTTIETRVDRIPKPYCYKSVTRTPDGGCHEQINRGYTVEERVIQIPRREYEWQWQQKNALQNSVYVQPLVVRPKKGPLCEFVEGALNFPGQLLSDLTEPCRRPKVQYVVPAQPQAYVVPSQLETCQPAHPRRPLVPVEPSLRPIPEPQPTRAPPRQ